MKIYTEEFIRHLEVMEYDPGKPEYFIGLTSTNNEAQLAPRAISTENPSNGMDSGIELAEQTILEETVNLQDKRFELFKLNNSIKEIEDKITKLKEL